MEVEKESVKIDESPTHKDGVSKLAANSAKQSKNFLNLKKLDSIIDGTEGEESENFYQPIKTPNKKDRQVDFSSDKLSLSKEPPSTSAKTVKEPVCEMKVFTYPNEQYNGEVDENFVRNGYGIYAYNNGDIYEGDFVDGLREGNGEYMYNDGSFYRGAWKEDKKHGQGSYKFDKYEFDGEWADDKLKNGFTFKVNKFIKHHGDDEMEDFDEKSSEESLDLDPDRIDDDDYVREKIAEHYKYIQSKDYKIDIDLYHINTGDSKSNLLNKIMANRLPTLVMEENSLGHTHNCEFAKYEVHKEDDEASFKCHCNKFKKQNCSISN